MFTDIVYEVENLFVPTASTEIGGFIVSKLGFSLKFAETTQEGVANTFPHVKVVKTDDVFTGFGSEDGITWVDRGYVVVTEAERLGVFVEGPQTYKFSRIKLYKNNYITLKQVSAGWKVETYYNNTLIHTYTSAGDSVAVDLPHFPFTGEMKVYDESNVLVATSILTDVWGGDEYMVSPDIQFLNKLGDDMGVMPNMHLGSTNQGFLEDYYILRNAENVSRDITVRIADYSPFFDWVQIGLDNGNSGTDLYTTTFDVTIPPLSDQLFWIKLDRPVYSYLTYFDYTKTEMSFYLEVL
jgi:hypothetical protein